MINNILHFIKSFALLTILSVVLFSCGKEDLSSIDTVIYVRNKGADLPVYIHGNGSEKIFILLLHGGPGGSSSEYRSGAFKHLIEKKYAVAYLDQRGSGVAQGNYSKSDVNIDLMTEDVIAVAKTMKKKYGEDSRLFLLGHSWGGLLGTSVLLRDNIQSLFKGWIEVDGGHDFQRMLPEAVRLFKAVANEQIAAGNSTSYWSSILNETDKIDTTVYSLGAIAYLNSEGRVAESKLEADGVINSKDSRVKKDQFISIFSHNPLTTYLNGKNISTELRLSGIFELSFTNQLSKIRIPSLFLWGKYDLVVPPHFGQDAFNKIGSSQKKLVFFERSGHSPIDREPDKFTNELIDFIETYK